MKRHWTDLKEKFPVDIDRIASIGREFNIILYCSWNNSTDFIRNRKLNARKLLDNFISELMMLLRGREFMKEAEDLFLLKMLHLDLSLTLKRLDEREEKLIEESITDRQVQVLSSVYERDQKIVMDALYDALHKSGKDYDKFDWKAEEKKKEEERIKKEPRTFFRILFENLTQTLSVLGGIAREKVRKPTHTVTQPWDAILREPERLKSEMKKQTQLEEKEELPFFESEMFPGEIEEEEPEEEPEKGGEGRIAR